MTTQLKITCPVCDGSGEQTENKTSDPQEAVQTICHFCWGDGCFDEHDVATMIDDVRHVGYGYHDEAMVFEELLRRAKG